MSFSKSGLMVRGILAQGLEVRRFMMSDWSVVHCFVRFLMVWSSDMSRSGVMDGLGGNDVFDRNMSFDCLVMNRGLVMADGLVVNW